MGLPKSDPYKNVDVAERVARFEPTVVNWEKIPVTSLGMIGMAAGQRISLIQSALQDISKAAEASKTAAAIFELKGRPDLFARMEKVAARTRTVANSNEARNVQLLTAISIVACCLPEALNNREAVVAFLHSVDILG
jgi:hypothetical protein